MANYGIGIIYFSKNRPLQLDLSISSNRNRCKDWELAEHYVIYRATNYRYEKAYENSPKYLVEHQGEFSEYIYSEEK